MNEYEIFLAISKTSNLLLNIVSWIIGLATTLFVGWLLAKNAILLNHKHAHEKEKLYLSNKVILDFERIIQVLQSTKTVYYHAIKYSEYPKHPVNRFINFPPVNFEKLDFDVDIGKYTFLITSNKKLADPYALNISRIMSIYQNINEVYNLLTKRNEMMTEANHKLLSSSHKQAVMTATPETVIKVLTPLKSAYLFYITEQIINYIDYLLIECLSWKKTFPNEVMKIIDLNYLENLDLGLISFPEADENYERNELFKPCPMLDFNKASEITGFTPNELKTRIFFNIVEKYHVKNKKNIE